MEKAFYKLDDFELYKKSRDFRKKVYAVIKNLPAVEKYALDPQMRRAAISVTNNLAEGHGRWHYQENIQFCRMARGSLEEIIDDLNICIDQGYRQRIDIDELKEEAYQLIKQINSYISYLKKMKSGNTETNH